MNLYPDVINMLDEVKDHEWDCSEAALAADDRQTAEKHEKRHTLLDDIARTVVRGDVIELDGASLANMMRAIKAYYELRS